MGVGGKFREDIKLTHLTPSGKPDKKFFQTMEAKDFKPKITHKDFLWDIVKHAKSKRWQTQYWWSSQHSPKGFLDLVLARPARLDYLHGLNRVIHSEVKIPPDWLTKEQQEWYDLWKEMGCEVYIWTPKDWDEIVKILE